MSKQFDTDWSVVVGHARARRVFSGEADMALVIVAQEVKRRVIVGFRQALSQSCKALTKPGLGLMHARLRLRKS